SDVRRERILVNIQKIPQRPADEIPIKKPYQATQYARLNILMIALSRKCPILISEEHHCEKNQYLKKKRLLPRERPQKHATNKKIELEQYKHPHKDARSRDQIPIPAAHEADNGKKNCQYPHQ